MSYNHTFKIIQWSYFFATLRLLRICLGCFQILTTPLITFTRVFHLSFTCICLLICITFKSNQIRQQCFISSPAQLNIVVLYYSRILAKKTALFRQSEEWENRKPGRRAKVKISPHHQSPRHLNSAKYANWTTIRDENTSTFPHMLRRSLPSYLASFKSFPMWSSSLRTLPFYSPILPRGDVYGVFFVN